MDSPNRAQLEHWNEIAGQKWVQRQADLDRLLASLGTLVMDRLPLRDGSRVLDVGCGCGATTLELAKRVGASGSVLGVDISAPMLARARERARDVPTVRFLEADVQTHRFDGPPFDAAYSRFGVMFFADPTAAFANVRRALRAGGALSFVCWQELRKNPWCLVPLVALAEHVPLPPPPPPGEPGPFAFDDPERVRRILDGAGFTEVRIDAHQQLLTLGVNSVDEAAEFATEAGPTARLLTNVAPDVKARVFAAIRKALTPFSGSEGVRLDGACWIVTAQNPG
jgi:SAM-dependent methyltransferase